MKQLTKSEFNKAGTTYKSVTSPATDNETTQISDIVIKNDHLAYSTDGSTFQQLTDEVQTISSIDTIYQSPNALPQSAANGTVYATLNNGELPIDLYKYDTNEWVLVDQVRAGVLYYVADQELLYTFKSTSPYFAAASYTDTSQLTNGAGYATTSDVTNAVNALEPQIEAKYTKPSGGIPASDLAQSVQNSLGLADSALQNSTDIENALGFSPVSSTDLQTEVTARQNADTTLQNNINAKYTLPSGGIPKTDLAQGVQDSLDAADSALQSINSNDVTTALGYTPYQKPSGGIPSTDLSSAVQTSLGKADTALQSISSSDVTSALGFTPYNSTNPSGYTKVEQSSTNGNIKINGSETTVYTLPNTVATTSDVGAVASDVSAIEAKIPAQATSSNQLADKDFVNSSINAFAAFYITKNAAGDPFATKAELNAATTFYSGGVARTPTTNDYCIVLADETKQSETGVDPTTRYSYQGNQWEYQYTINDTPLTSAQLAALNSGITSSLVTTFNNKQDALTFDANPTQNSNNPVKSGGVYSALSGKENTSNKVVSISSNSTDTQYPSAKCVYDAIQAGTAASNTLELKASNNNTLTLTAGTSEATIKGKYSVGSAQNILSYDGQNTTVYGDGVYIGYATFSNGAYSGTNAVTLMSGDTRPYYYNGTNHSIALLDDVPSSINGLSGGSLTSPLVIKGGDATTAAKIALDQTASGQITNNGTQTLFGFTTNNATTLTVGHSSYAMALRGSGTKPTYNGNNMALVSDIPTKTSQLSNDSGFVTADTGATSVATSGSGNAFTSASYDAATRKITFTKGSTFLTSAPVSSVAGYTGAVTAANLVSAILTGAASYGDKISAKSMGASGYITFSSGLKIAWGVANHGSSAYDWTANISFGITFTNKPAVVSTPLEASGSGCWSYVYQSLSTTGCTLRQTSKPNANGKAQYIYWIAIGY